jgi:predicted nucleic acid binding AN1-type Zn finger protein
VARHIFKPARCGYTLRVTSHKQLKKLFDKGKQLENFRQQKKRLTIREAYKFVRLFARVTCLPMEDYTIFYDQRLNDVDV